MANSKEYMREYMRQYSADRRQKALGLLGGKCVVCGSTQNLEIDHIDPTTKSFTLARGWHHAWDKVVKELEKCQILCSTHHIEKSKIDNKKEITHGRYWSAYVYKCKCEICSNFKVEYNKQRRQKRKGQ